MEKISASKLLAGLVPAKSWPSNFSPGNATKMQPGRTSRLSVVTSSTCTSSRSEEHTSELQSLSRISYAVFWLGASLILAGIDMMVHGAHLHRLQKQLR